MVVPEDRARRPLEERIGPRFQVTGFTNLRELSEQADVILHHCGHATLHTVLLAGKPAITLPSGEYDREDNALQLEDMTCGRHLGHDFFRKGLSSDAMSAAIKQVLADSGIKNSVTAMSRIVKEYQQKGKAEFVSTLEQLLRA
jgi:UDP:flavonoid glycosyltransferase YjiC (YdhE family)